jgi:uncharacterized protein YrrD
MRRIDQIAALAVIDANSGKRLGKIAQVLLDGPQRRMAGVSLKADRWFEPMRFIAFENIALFGKFSMLVDPKIKSPMPEENLKLGSRVYAQDGTRLGWYTNALIDETDGTIWALEYSQGYIGDLLGQRSWVRAFSCGAESISVLTDEPMLRI